MRRLRFATGMCAALGTALVLDCTTKFEKSYTCVRDDGLLAQELACVNDDDCPCGAHCAFGACTHECTADEECAGGEACDLFGRCVAGSGEGLDLEVDAGPRAPLEVEPALVEFLAASEVKTVALSASERDPGPVRLRADQGLEVRCDPEESFGRECTIEDLEPGAGTPRRAELRATAPMPADVDRYLAVMVFTESQRRTVGVRLKAPAAAPAPRPDGIYQGYARIEAAGLSSHSWTIPVPDEISGVRFPVSATVFEDSGAGHVVALEDELGAVFPGPGLAGLLEQAGGAWSLDLADVHYLGPDGPGAGDVEIVMSTSSESIYWQGGNLTARLRVEYRGATLDSYAPFISWRVALARAADLPGDAVAPPLTADYEPALAPERAADPLAIEGMVLDRLPPDLGTGAAERASAALCTPADVDFPEYPIDAIALVDGVDVHSGDLGCEDTGPQLTFGVLATNLLTVNETIATCIDDLGKVQEVLDGDPTVLLTTDGCLDPARVVTALGIAIETDRDRALGTASTPDPSASSLAHRLLQQWADVHGFIARETMQVHKMNEILSEEERAALAFTIPEALARSLGGWDLFMNPRVAVGMANMPAEVLGEPDYRYRLFPDAVLPLAPTHDQGVGVAATVLGVLGTQAQIARSLLSDVRSGNAEREDVEPVLGELLRRTFVMYAMAQGMYGSARTVEEPGWQAEWDLGALSLGAALGGILVERASLGSGQNPLGIDENDLPLYRIGDEVGAADRFSALSDYLLGVGTDDSAVAPSMVIRAQDALDEARDAWVANLEWNLTTKLDSLERSRRIEGVNRRYGEEIGSLCGDPSWTSDTILAYWNQIDPDTCFFNDDCETSDEDQLARLTTASLGYNICLTSKLRQRLGPNVSSGDDALDATIDEMGVLLGVAAVPFPIYIYQATLDTIIVYGREAGRWELPTASLRNLKLALPEDMSAQFILDAVSACSSSREATLAERPSVPPATCVLSDECPVDYYCSAGACALDLGVAGAENPECYFGSLGEMAMSIIGAVNEIEIARSEYAEYTQRYDIAMRSCIIAQAYHDQMEAALAGHNETMSDLGAGKLAADIASFAAAAAKEMCNIGSEILSGGGIAAAAAAEAAAQSVSAGLEYAMEEAERDHEENMMNLEHAMDDTICLNDAEMELVGTETAALRIVAAQTELSELLIEFRNLKNELRGLLAEGHTAVENETDRRLSPMAMDFWLDEKIEIYRDYLRQAKRVVYLTVLAVEYEFQLSSLERQAVLEATTPMELLQVIDNLRSYVMTGTVGGASPANLLTVLSLRDHLVQIVDRSEFPDGWHAMTETERFRLWLTSRSHAVYDETGAYLGQEMRFGLQPLGAMGMGQTAGIPVLTGTDCAERLWSVNASLMGDDLYTGSETTMTRVVLKKKNTFMSQWCTPPGTSPWQVASTRPSRNLFLDPFGFEESLTPSTPVPDTTTVDEINAFSTARISAYFNVTRAQMEDESYFNGDSQELAGRGLYGEYSILFPAETLSIDGTDGLNLENVEDVLLRFDYVSVAK